MNPPYPSWKFGAGKPRFLHASPYISGEIEVSPTLFSFFFKFIYLAALGLSCGMWDLHCGMRNPFSCGMWDLYL